MFRSIKTRILTSQVGLVILISVILGFSTYFLMIHSLMKSQERTLEYIAQDQADRLGSLITDKERMIERIANGEAVRVYSQAYQETLLLEYFNKFMAEFPILAYVNEDGLEELKVNNGGGSEELSDISETTLFEEAIWEPNKVFTSFSASGDKLAKAQMEFALCRQSFFGEFEGFIIGRIPLSDLFMNIQEFKFGETGFLTLIDDQGAVLSRPQKENILQKAAVQGKHSEKIISQVKAMKSGFGRATILGIDGYVAYAPVKGRNWAIIATLPYEEFMTAPNTMRNTALGVSLGILIVGILVSLAMAKGITNPILKLATASGLIAKGDLSQRVDIRSKDEIKILAESFNKMTGDLHKAIVSRDQEIAERERAEEALQKAHDKLEQRVEERTRKLARTTEQLEQEIAERQSTQQKLQETVYRQQIAYDQSIVYAKELNEEIMERKRAQEALQKAHDELEQRVEQRTAELKKANEQLKVEMQERERMEQERLNREKLQGVIEMAGGVCHELNQPMQAIAVYSELLMAEMSQDNPLCGDIEEIKAQILRMGKITKKLMRITKYETKDYVFEGKKIIDIDKASDGVT